MSALPPKADICSATADVRFAPESGHVQGSSPCPLRANSGHSRDSKKKPPPTADVGVIIDKFSLPSRNQRNAFIFAIAALRN